MALANRRSRHPFALQFLLALVIAAPLCAQRILAAWADLAESRLVALFVAHPNERKDPAQLLDAVRGKESICDGRVVRPEEVESWVKASIGEAAASADTTTPTTVVPIVLELAFRGSSVRRPEAFRTFLAIVRGNPACARLFFDEDAQEKAAEFYGRARTGLRFGLLLALVAAFAAMVGLAPTEPSPSTEEGPGPDRAHSISGTASAWIWAFGRATGPAVAAWFCLFAILSLWPIPSPEGVPLAAHGIVLAATIVLHELLHRAAAAVSRRL